MRQNPVRSRAARTSPILPPFRLCMDFGAADASLLQVGRELVSSTTLGEVVLTAAIITTDHLF